MVYSMHARCAGSSYGILCIVDDWRAGCECRRRKTVEGWHSYSLHIALVSQPLVLALLRTALRILAQTLKQSFVARATRDVN